MTISKFEKILVEIRGRADLRDKLYLEDEAIKLHQAYNAAKAASLDELVTFRQTYSTTPVTVAPDVTSVDDLFKNT